MSTIKRFWDDSYNKSFQISTLNALGRFLGYENWHQFKEKNYEETVSTEALQGKIKKSSKSETQK
ncbi:MAG: hypothetical protein HC831_01540 [Chloroflexia bacterium]|nr:hypothetical protein [Chloroflexia bacterium]